MDYQKGQIVLSRAGRDKGRFLAVVATSQGRVLVADGKEHRLAKPKAKNPKHLSGTCKVLADEAFAQDSSLSRAIAACTAAPPTT
ncbi:MAG: KOW domain-containing RNA-binding protein [Pygmaiobacter massiliensis]|nr:KOW domain-containing RNA-binding protein [Pygmaiobacter massiliensis]